MVSEAETDAKLLKLLAPWRCPHGKPLCSECLQELKTDRLMLRKMIEAVSK